MTAQDQSGDPSHQFHLARVGKVCQHIGADADYLPVRMYACPQPRPQAPGRLVQVLPRYNRDHQYYTPAFVVEMEQVEQREICRDWDANEKEKFGNRVRAEAEYPTQQEVEFSPRVDSDNYCSCCQANFRNYWQHLNGARHKNSIRSTRANQYIHELCRAYCQEGTHASGNIHTASMVPPRKGKIIRKHKGPTRTKANQSYKSEDFIIRIPADLMAKQPRPTMASINASSLNSTNIQPKE